MAPLGIRKQPSGAEKRRSRKHIQEFVKSQANSMLKFLKKPETSSETIGAQRNNRDDIGQSKVDPENLDECKVSDEQEEVKKEEHVYEDMSDPGNWRNVDTRLRHLLVENGPATRLPSDYQFPKDATGRHFSHALYIRELVDGEKVDRQWLVYSKALDKVYCFGCKLFRDDDQKDVGGTLATTGYNDWSNVSTVLKEHERSCDHIRCGTRWKLLEKSLQKKEHISEDMFDPGNWRNVDTRLRELLVENGPVARLPSNYQFPKDAIGRHFSHACYIRVMANGEKLDRKWLVYSKALDKAFCFCCKLFKEDHKNGGHLVTTGYNDWKHVSTRLKEHETSYDHILCMTRWRELEIRQQDNQTIDIGKSKAVHVMMNLDECRENDEKEEFVYQSEGSEKKKEHVSEDVSDPGNWGKVDTKWRDLLVKVGPTTRLPSDYQFPKDGNGRRFSHALYIRELVNGEKVDRQWLVYSRALDKAFCFCCKLFKDDQKNVGGMLATTGYNDWKHVSTRLKEHERSYDHMLCMTRWKLGKSCSL